MRDTSTAAAIRTGWLACAAALALEGPFENRAAPAEREALDNTEPANTTVE